MNSPALCPFSKNDSIQKFCLDITHDGHRVSVPAEKLSCCGAVGLQWDESRQGYRRCSLKSRLNRFDETLNRLSRNKSLDPSKHLRRWQNQLPKNLALFSKLDKGLDLQKTLVFDLAKYGMTLKPEILSDYTLWHAINGSEARFVDFNSQRNESLFPEPTETTSSTLWVISHVDKLFHFENAAALSRMIKTLRDFDLRALLTIAGDSQRQKKPNTETTQDHAFSGSRRISHKRSTLSKKETLSFATASDQEWLAQMKYEIDLR